MLELPTNCWTYNERATGQALKQCPSFWDICGEIEERAAFNHIFYESLASPANGETYTEAELVALKGTAVISSPTEAAYAMSVRRSSRLDPQGLVTMLIEMSVPDEDYANQSKADEVVRYMKNRIGNIMNEMLAIFHGSCDETMAIKEIGVTNGPSFNDKADHAAAGVLIMTALMIRWDNG